MEAHIATLLESLLALVTTGAGAKATDAGIGTSADAKVDTDAEGTLSAKLRGIVSRLIELIGWTSSPTIWTAVAKSDSTDLTGLATKGLLVGGAGDIAVRLSGAPSTTVTQTVVAGQYLPGNFTRVMAATTATGITALS
jgi:hypothetical protein